MAAVVVKQREYGAYSGRHILKEWKRQEKEEIPLYDLLIMGKLGALTQKNPPVSKEEGLQLRLPSGPLEFPFLFKSLSFIRGLRRFD